MAIQKTYEATLIRVKAGENNEVKLMTGEIIEGFRVAPDDIVNDDDFLVTIIGGSLLVTAIVNGVKTVQLSDIENDINEKIKNGSDVASVAIEYKYFFHSLAENNKELINDVVKPKHFKACGIKRTKKLIESLNAGEIDYIKGFVFFHMVSSGEVLTLPKFNKDKKGISNETKFDSTEFESTVLRVVFIDGKLLTINGTVLEGYRLMVPGNKKPGESFLVTLAGGRMLCEEVATERGIFKLSEIIDDIMMPIHHSPMHNVLGGIEKYRYFFEQLFEHNEKLIEEHVKPIDYDRAGIVFERNSDALASGRFNYVKGYVFLKLVNEGKLVTKPMKVVPASIDFSNTSDFRNMGQPRFGMERGGHYNFIPRNNTHGVDTPYGLINGQLNEGFPSQSIDPWDMNVNMNHTTINTDNTTSNKQRTTPESLLEALDSDLKLSPDISNAMEELSVSIKKHLMTFDKEQRVSIEKKVRVALYEGDTVTLMVNGLIKDLCIDNDNDVAILTTHNGRRYYSEKLNTVPLKAISNIVATKKIY